MPEPRVSHTLRGRRRDKDVEVCSWFCYFKCTSPAVQILTSLGGVPLTSSTVTSAVTPGQTSSLCPSLHWNLLRQLLCVCDAFENMNCLGNKSNEANGLHLSTCGAVTEELLDTSRMSFLITWGLSFSFTTEAFTPEQTTGGNQVPPKQAPFNKDHVL